MGLFVARRGLFDKATPGLMLALHIESQILSRLDQLGDEVLAHAVQRLCLRPPSRLNGFAVRALQAERAELVVEREEQRPLRRLATARRSRLRTRRHRASPHGPTQKQEGQLFHGIALRPTGCSGPMLAKN